MEYITLKNYAHEHFAMTLNLACMRVLYIYVFFVELLKFLSYVNFILKLFVYVFMNIKLTHDDFFYNLQK